MFEFNQNSLFNHSLDLNAYFDFKYTCNLDKNINSIVDYLFFENKYFKLKNTIPMLTHQDVIKDVQIPSKTIPSDHLAVIF